MIANPGKRIALTASVALAMGILPASAPAQQQFQLHSTTFSNGSTLPLSTILNNQVNGVNTCSINGAAGGDESPELSWTGAPRGTQSYVVVLYDTTASFTHWGMYNIGGNVTQLPKNAGKAGSPFGMQVENDFDLGRTVPAGGCYARHPHLRLYGVCAEHDTTSNGIGQLPDQC